MNPHFREEKRFLVLFFERHSEPSSCLLLHTFWHSWIATDILFLLVSFESYRFVCLIVNRAKNDFYTHAFILRWNTRQDKFFSVLTSIKIFWGAANHLKTITIVFVQLLFKKILLINILRALNIIPIQLNFFHKTNLSTNSSPNMSMFHNSADEITLSSRKRLCSRQHAIGVR